MPRTTKTAGGIRCETCGELTTEIIRTTPQSNYVIRRRQCPAGHRTTTVERPAKQPPPDATAIGNGQLAISISQLRESVEEVAKLSGLNNPHSHNTDR